MDWQLLDLPTRVGLVATVIAVLAVVVPPVSVASALVAVAFSGAAVRRARGGGRQNRVAGYCLTVSIGLLVLVVVGSAIYASGG